MAKFSRNDLTGEYAWTEFKPDDPRVSGTVDDTPFNGNEGHEVLYLITTLTKEWDLRNIKSGHKMERMLRDLPPEAKTQADAKKWIKEKWNSYRSKVASSKRESKESPQT